MTRNRSLIRLAAIVPFALILAAGCGGTDEAEDDPSDSAADSAGSDGSTSDSSTTTDTGSSDDTSSDDTSMGDTGSAGDTATSGDTSTSGDTKLPDAMVDSKLGDSASVDSSVSDTATLDTATLDTATSDTATSDTAVSDTATDVSTTPKGPAPVALGMAGDYVILAESGISTVPTSIITGDIGISPFGSTSLTGFSMTKAGTFFTDIQVIGKIYAVDNDPPTPINLGTANTNMKTAYTDAATRPTPDFLNLGTGAIGGLTLVPGLYKWTSSVGVASDVTVSGGPNDTWIFQVTGDLTAASAKSVKLGGFAKAKNIVWQVAGLVDLDTDSHFEGIILCKTGITLRTGASVTGRLLAQTAVAIAKSRVTLPTP